MSISFISTCQSQDKQAEGNILVYDRFDELQTRIELDTQTTWVINFWATTCPPCLKEMPHFKDLQRQYLSKQVKVLLVNLDEMKDLETRVLPYIQKYKIEPEVVMLSDINYNIWTDFVDKSWYGALPATLILRNHQRAFKFGAYPTLLSIESDLAPFLEE